MAQLLVAFGSGLLFALGLVVADVTDPSTVLDFLDVAGTWNPQLGLVVGAAVTVAAFGQLIVRRQSKPVFAQCFATPSSKRIDLRLVTGSILFGVGWGLVGYCPAPAISGLMLFDPRTVVFVVAMISGMVAFHWIHERGAKR